MGLIKIWEKAIKKIDWLDVALIKISTAALVLFVITIWPAAMDLVHSIHWGWFLAALIILAARPFYRAYIK